jgi:hypothetical protein
MQKDARATNRETMDPAMIAAIAREVIARLKTTSQSNQAETYVDARVITTSTLEELNGNPTQLIIPPSALITPAARDEARQRGISFKRSADGQQTQQAHHARLEIFDSADPARAEAIRTQLARRSVGGIAAKIVLSDTPAREVHQQCAAQGKVAVMISDVTDVQRFADELSPNVWVLDMKKLNLAAAVNAVTQITRFGDSHR